MKQLLCISVLVINFSIFNSFSQEKGVHVDYNSIMMFEYPQGFKNLITAYKSELYKLDNETKRKYLQYFFKHVMDSTDYLGNITENFDLLPSLDKQLISKTNNNYYYSELNYSNPNRIENDSIYEIIDLPSYDEQGEWIMDENGDLITKAQKVKFSADSVVKGIKIIEDWNYDDQKFIKTSKIISIWNVTHDDQLHPIKKERYNFHVPVGNNKRTKVIPFMNDFSYDFLLYPQWILKDIIKDSMDLKSNDYEYRKHREESTKKFDIKSHNLNQYEFSKLTQSIIKDCQENKLMLLDLTGEKIKYDSSLLSYYSSTPTYDTMTGDYVYDKNGNIIYKKQTNYYSMNDIIGFRFYEDWHLDKKQFNIIKKVNAISLIAYTFDDNGSITGYKTIPFKIKFTSH